MKQETDIERARRLARIRAWKKRHPGRDAEYSAARRKREADATDRPRFVCAKCGRTFDLPTSPEPAVTERARTFVVLGGRKVCEVCARARFKRRPDPWATFGNAP